MTTTTLFQTLPPHKRHHVHFPSNRKHRPHPVPYRSFTMPSMLLLVLMATWMAITRRALTLAPSPQQRQQQIRNNNKRTNTINSIRIITIITITTVILAIMSITAIIIIIMHINMYINTTTNCRRCRQRPMSTRRPTFAPAMLRRPTRTPVRCIGRSITERLAVLRAVHVVATPTPTNATTAAPRWPAALRAQCRCRPTANGRVLVVLLLRRPTRRHRRRRRAAAAVAEVVHRRRCRDVSDTASPAR